MIRLIALASFLTILITTAKTLPTQNQWTTRLGTQYPGITPLFSKLGKNQIVIASVLQENGKSPLSLEISSYDLTGNIKTKCKIDSQDASDRIWDIKMTELDEQKVVISWVHGDNVKEEVAIKLQVIDVSNCSSGSFEVQLFEDMDSIFYVPYSIVANDDETFDIFVRSPNLCGEGICQLRKSTRIDLLEKNIETKTFLADDTSLFFKIIPTESSAKAYFYISEAEGNTANPSVRITKLNSNGRVTKSIDARLYLSGITTFSNAYGSLGFCSVDSNNRNVSCSLVDSQLNEKLEVRLSFELRVRQISAVNLKDGGLMVIAMTCEDEKCAKRVILRKTIEADGSVGEDLEHFRSEDGCFARKFSDGFVDEDEQIHCSVIPCVRKENAKDVTFDVSVDVKCVKL